MPRNISTLSEKGLPDERRNDTTWPTCQRLKSFVLMSVCIIREAILSIDDHLEGRRNFHEYETNKTKRGAVEMELEIIGEAIIKRLKINPAFRKKRNDG